ncbi:portal protein [Gluconobacter oxydans]|uniref:portal protein n=1 Tax=Gluconobacter oxydans TaxID=442 RepID=UPI000783B757|nr:portal protein [Gluconobacter oxydans]KXV12571.1 hypothetical protein AD932_06565 [Gluconobacter oxydans]
MSDTVPGTDSVISEVKERYEAAQSFEADWRRRALDDLRFFHADAYNHDQWDSAVYQARSGTFGGSPRPCLTINKVQQHVFQIENDARQSQMGMKVNATGFGSNEKAADVIEGIIRHIEYQSNAQQNAYNCAIQGQVRQGMGWVHVVTDYVRGQDSFDQDFFIKSVPDPRSVYSDPNTQEPDHSDMQWAMIVEEMPRHEFERLYPDHKDLSGSPLSIAGDTDYRGQEVEKDVVRIFRYYRRNEEKDTLWAVPVPQQDGSVSVQPMRQSAMPNEMVEYCRAQKAQSRPITRPHVEFYLIAGDRVVSHGPTVFRHIPLVPFVGIESVVDGRLDRCGLVRSLIDPQRMFNYSASAFVESIAVQTKSPWLVDERSIEGYENQWANANTSNAAWLPYRSIDPDTTEALQPPQRLDPPTGSTGHMQAMQNADLQMQMVTGQYQAEMGAPGNERSGRAINERQRQSDTANYHYTDNQGMALRLLGRILIDAIPLVYDTARAVQVLGMDGTQSSAIVDPQAQQAAQVVLPPGPNGQPQQSLTFEQQLAQEGAILAVNPTIGRYDVEADVGPAFATRRQDTFNSLMQVLQANPAIMGQIGDLFFKAADFPLADEIADRLKPASDDPRLGQAQQTIQQLQAQLQQITQQLKDKQQDFDLRANKQRHDQVIDLMDADTKKREQQTDEMAAIGSISPESLKPVLENLIRTILAEQGKPDAPVPEVNPQPLERLPSTNPPGGEIHAPNPVTGAVDV